MAYENEYNSAIMIYRSLEEAAEEYEQTRQDTDARSDNEIVRRAFITGAEWQAEKCDEETSKLLYAERQTAYINGWDDHKVLMLKDAVEGFIFQSEDYYPKELIARYDGELKHGDKVKVIILKDNEDESK